MESLNQSEVTSSPEVQRLAAQYQCAVDALAGPEASSAANGPRWRSATR